MPSRKRGHDEVDQSEADSTLSLLQQVRNCWQFASLMQYIHIFGDAAKISEHVDVDMLEEECLKVPHSDQLTEIGLCMLRMVSSHRGLTPEIFDEYTRRQYVAKAPLRNPFGEDELPIRFADMDIFTRLTVLHQLSVWTFFNEDRMRDRMPEKDTTEQLNWRIDPAGWDSDDCEYYVLDDNRLYRLTKPSLPPPPPKKVKAKPKSKPKKAPPPKPRGSRSSKRQRLLNGDEDEDEDEDSFIDTKDEQDEEPELERTKELAEPEDNGLGGAKWELLAITLDEYRAAMEPFRKSRDINEKNLYKYLEQNSLPALERAAASHARKAAARQRELEALAKMANAKRSSRISSRQQQIKDAEESAAAERRKRDELAEAHREHERQAKIEAERESRMMTREQRIKDREMKRILHEEELEKLRAVSEQSEGQEGRISQRNRKAKLEKSQRELDQLREEEENWDFDCSICGVHGKNLDDGTHSMACEKCGVWQHSACHGISEAKAESDDFHFTCAACSKPKPPKVKPEDKSALPAVNGHAAGQIKQAPRLHDRPTLPAAPPLQNGQHYVHAPPAAQAVHYPHVPPQQHGSVNGHTYSNGAAPSTQYPPPTLPRPHVAPSWEAPPSPSKPLTPSQPHLSASRYNPSTAHTPQAYRQSPSFESQAGGASPTPSLAATQGNTNVRFSPTQQRHGAFGGGSQAYTPASDLPSAAAYSPTKKVGSSPPQPKVGRLQSPTGAHPSPYALNAGPAGAGLPPSSQASVIPGSAGGVSPVKHDVASSPIPAPITSGLGISNHLLSRPEHTGLNSSPAHGPAPGSSFGRPEVAAGIRSPPSLSPSVNTGIANLSPPRKKSPEVVPAALPLPRFTTGPSSDPAYTTGPRQQQL